MRLQAIAAMMRAQEVDPTNLEVLLALGVSHTNGKFDPYLLVLPPIFPPVLLEIVCQNLLSGLIFADFSVYLGTLDCTLASTCQ